MKPHISFETLYHQIALATILFIAAGLNVQAQVWTQYDQGTPPQHAAGVSPVGSYISSDLGTVNLGNGSLNLSLPLGTVGGRGFSIPLSLNYSSKVWSVAHETTFDPDRERKGVGGDVTVAYATYGQGESWVDIYQRLAAGWTISGVPQLKWQGVGIWFTCQNGYPVYSLTKLSLVLPDKGELELRDDASDGAPLNVGCTPNGNNRGRRWHATDGSGIVFISDQDNGLTGTLITRDGMRYRFEGPNVQFNGGGGTTVISRCVWITDRNGNRIVINHFINGAGHVETDYTDQLGRTIKVEQSAADPDDPSTTLALLVTFKGYQGTVRYYKVKTDLMRNRIRSDFNYNQLPIFTGYSDRYGYCYFGEAPPAANYIFPGSYCMNQERIDNQNQVSQLILPDGRSLNFKYNLFGELAEVVLPTSAKLQYDYNAALTLPSGNTLNMEYHAQANSVGGTIDRAIVQRRSYPDGATLEGSWTYAFETRAVNGSNYACTEVKAFAGDPTNGTLLMDQRHFFLQSGRYLNGTLGVISGTGYSLWSTGIEWRTETLDAAGDIINATEQDWAQRAPVAWSSGWAQEQPANDNRVSQTRNYLDDGSFAKTETLYDNVNYPQANNVSEVREYDFDQSFKRLTRTTYVAGNYQTDDAIHLLSLVSQQSVFSDSAGTNEVARTVNEYDVYVAEGTDPPIRNYGTVIGHDDNYGPTKITRGNLTATGRWRNTDNTTIYSYLRYDTLGNPISNKDPKGNVTSLDYADNFGDGSNPAAAASGSFGATYAFPTLITSPPPAPGAPVHTARTQFDFWSGLLSGFKDRNGVVTQTIYNDPFSRPTMVKSALGTSVETHAVTYYAPTTAYGISLNNNDVLTAKDQATVDDGALRSGTHTDGFGRTVETWSRGPQGDEKVITVYDALSRVRQQSNPYRQSLGESAIYTTTVYDLAGRVTSVTTPDSAAVNSYYRANRVLVKDQMGKERLSKTNALGQLVEVWEITGADDATESVSFPNHSEVTAGYRTNYSYSTLGNLTGVTQRKGLNGPTQTRTFVYNSLSQLTDATNPESGHITYDYDPNGNLWHKIDARPVTATYSYDALNRNTSVDYSDATPDVFRQYDLATNGKGRINQKWQGGNTTSMTNVDEYDAVGRPKIQRQRYETAGVWSNSYQVSRVYNLDGSVSSQTYPSGNSVAYTYDVAGRTGSFTGNLAEGGAPRSYSTEITYSPLGGMSKEKFGSDIALYNKLFYNSRGQLAEIRVGSYHATDNTWWNRGAIINFYSTCWGMCGGHNSTASMTDNNGNLKRQEVYVPGDDLISSSTMWAQQYDYDNLNRLASVQETTGDSTHNWRQEYDYDRYGNRTIDQTNTSGPTVGPLIPKPNFEVEVGTNRLLAPGDSGLPLNQRLMQYDAAGNLEKDNLTGAGERIYDAENRMTKARGNNNGWQEYAYNADGQRVRRTVDGVETWQVYGFDGELLAEYAVGTSLTSPQKEYGYRNGQLLITAEGGGPNLNNSGFEAPWLGGPNYQYNPTGGSWTFAGQTGVSGNSSDFTAGNPAAPQGSQVAFLQGGSWSIISQSTSFQAGVNYKIAFRAAQRGNYQAAPQSFDVYLDTMLLGTFQPGGTSYTELATNPFTTTSGAHTIKFIGRDATGGNTAFLDSVAVQVVQTTSLSVGNNGFEAPWLGGPNYQYNPTGGSWTFAGQSGVSGNYSDFTAGNPVAPQGSQVAFLQGGTWSVISETISGFDSAATYTVAFKAAQRGNYQAAPQSINVYLDAVLLGTFQPSGTSYQEITTTAFTTSAGAHVLKFVGTDATGGNTAFIDDVRVTGTGGQSSGAQINWLVTDQLGTPRMVFDQTGSLANTKRHDYLPFGEELVAGQGLRATGNGFVADAVRQKFTSKERDIETGLDYFEARYYSSVQGRFTSPDPIFFQKEMLLDPQRFNLYGYVRNNPLKLADPKGLAIELTGDEAERKRRLAAVQQAVGPVAGAYLYENKGKDGKYYIGIYTNGPDGKGKPFEQINSVAGDFSKVIKDSFVAKIELVPQGYTAKFEGGEYTIGRVDTVNNVGPGASYVNKDGSATIWLLDPKYDPGMLPSAIMENNQALQVVLSDALAHEIGHVEARWGHVAGPSKTNGVDLENRARRLRDPNAPLRLGHDLGTPRDAVGPQPLIINVRPGTERGWKP